MGAEVSILQGQLGCFHLSLRGQPFVRRRLDHGVDGGVAGVPPTVGNVWSFLSLVPLPGPLGFVLSPFQIDRRSISTHQADTDTDTEETTRKDD